jgi:hypothetical protein
MKISKLLSGFAKKFKGYTYEQRMDAYLSQATSREHLEQLEREWFNHKGRQI